MAFTVAVVLWLVMAMAIGIAIQECISNLMVIFVLSGISGVVITELCFKIFLYLAN